MKFLADMGVSLKTVSYLRLAGHDAVHLRDEGLQRLDDDLILQKAEQEQRVLLTMDLDFGYLMSLTGAMSPSVVLFRLGDESVEVVNDRLDEVIELCETDLIHGAVVSVNEESIRVRRLPIAGN